MRYSMLPVEKPYRLVVQPGGIIAFPMPPPPTNDSAFYTTCLVTALTVY